MEELRFDEIFTQLKDKYKTVFTYTGFPDGIVIYRPLTRSQYYELFENEQLMDVEREDIVCYNCILYPEKFRYRCTTSRSYCRLSTKDSRR